MKKDSHPDNSPFCIVDARDEGDPPCIRWYKSKKLAIDDAQKFAFNRGDIYRVFELKRIATVEAQAAKVYEE